MVDQLPRVKPAHLTHPAPVPAGEAVRTRSTPRAALPAACAILAAVASSLTGCAGGRPASAGPDSSSGLPDLARGAVALVAHAVIPTGTRFDGLEVGGLSAVAYDPGTDELLAVSDAPREHPPARLLRFRWHPPAAPEPLGWLPLEDGTGALLPLPGADLEGLARLPEGGFLVSSEGDRDAGLAPWVARFDATARWRGELPLPPWYAPAPAAGLPHNAGFEALALGASALEVFAASEGEPLQDAAARAAAGDGGLERRRARLLSWRLAGGGSPREWLYPLEPPHAASPVPDGLRVAGLVALLALDERTLLALERSFVLGVGHRAALFAVTLGSGDEVTGRAVAPGGARPLRKRLLLDFASLGVPLDNYEGMTWSRPDAAGRRLLVVVGDNNFRAEQDTHLLALRF